MLHRFLSPFSQFCFSIIVGASIGSFTSLILKNESVCNVLCTKAADRKFIKHRATNGVFCRIPRPTPSKPISNGAFLSKVLSKNEQKKVMYGREFGDGIILSQRCINCCDWIIPIHRILLGEKCACDVICCTHLNPLKSRTQLEQIKNLDFLDGREQICIESFRKMWMICGWSQGAARHVYRVIGLSEPKTHIQTEHCLQMMVVAANSVRLKRHQLSRAHVHGQAGGWKGIPLKRICQNAMYNEYSLAYTYGSRQ